MNVKWSGDRDLVHEAPGIGWIPGTGMARIITTCGLYVGYGAVEVDDPIDCKVCHYHIARHKAGLDRGMRASELVARLQELIEEHGDLAMFSEADWEEISDAEHWPASYSGGPSFRIMGGYIDDGGLYQRIMHEED